MLTLFPDLIRTVTGTSITGRAMKKGAFAVETVNIRDAASIANKLGLNLTPPKTFTAPNKADYNLKTIKGMKNYINDMVIYKAKMQYGIADIKADDTIKSNT